MIEIESDLFFKAMFFIILGFGIVIGYFIRGRCKKEKDYWQDIAKDRYEKRVK